MSQQCYIVIEDEITALEIIRDAKGKAGLLKDVSVYNLKKVLDSKEFPIKIPIDLEAVIKIISNPVVKRLAGGKIEEHTKKYLKCLEAGVV